LRESRRWRPVWHVKFYDAVSSKVGALSRTRQQFGREFPGMKLFASQQWGAWRGAGIGRHTTPIFSFGCDLPLLKTMAPTLLGKARHGKPSKSKTQTRTLKRKRDEEDLQKLMQAVVELVKSIALQVVLRLY